ncbi:MAG: glycoside hydrolase family 3 C-terminal domain-containing protein, partial [Clostridium sp.]|nr:glycoside hydrolase family 3 C-terminal domain-containing protein [Clostridium sp.]
MTQYIYKNSTFPLDVRVKSLISLLTLDEKISLLPTRQAAIERLNISEYSVGGEAAHGVVSNTGPSTVFPQPLGLASTFDEKLLEEIGSVIGDEARIYYDKSNRKYGLTLWAPTIDMERDPRWGRTEEAYGEDPILTGKLSSNLIKGMQGYDDFYLKLVPAPKHFYGNNNEEGRIYCSSSIDKRNKNEYYLKAFKPAFVEGKAKSMMTAYNSINGTPCILNKEVQDIVKDTWRCDGFIVCDGGDFSQTVDYHKYYKTHAETIAAALKAGIDCFTDDAELVINAAKEAISRNLITEKDIDKAISNILKIRFRLGQFDDDSLNPYANICPEKLCSKSHSELSLKACLESIVLLKNENNILPLKEDKINSLAILGPLANEIYRDWYCVTPPYKVTMLDGIKNKLINK